MLVGALVVFLVVNYQAVLDPQNFSDAPGAKLKQSVIRCLYDFIIFPFLLRYRICEMAGFSSLKDPVFREEFSVGEH